MGLVIVFDCVQCMDVSGFQGYKIVYDRFGCIRCLMNGNDLVCWLIVFDTSFQYLGICVEVFVQEEVIDDGDSLLVEFGDEFL